jgi:hypothetical protein
VRKVLVIANETLAGRALLDEIVRRVNGDEAEVLVVCPALNSRLKHWASDDVAARQAASERLVASLATLAALGIDARGEVGDADPVQAIEDALRTWAATEIVVSTHPPGRSTWLERKVTSAAARFRLPVTHVVVDLRGELATA